jgi:hypothetical protein
MIDLGKVHEREVFELEGASALSWRSVEPTMGSLGFMLVDDFARLPRHDVASAWQSETVASCDFFSRGQQVYPEESDFEVIRFSMLVATLPEQHATAAIRVLHSLAERLSLRVSYAGMPVSSDDTLALLKRWLTEIIAETGDTSGSESVRMLIEMAYQKKNA